MNQKICFFDIDGTLWDRQQKIPMSTVHAIQKLRENGHLAYLNSGRTRTFIRGEGLFELGFDGVVAGCGTYVESAGKIEQNIILPHEVVCETVAELKKTHMPLVLEGHDCLYADAEDFPGDFFYGYLVNLMGKDLQPIAGHEGRWQINKMSVNMVHEKMDQVLGTLNKHFQIVYHAGEFMELVPKGVSKASGMDYVCKLHGIDIKDTLAFGDSTNDLEMLEHAGVGVVMGNGTPDAKEVGDFVTKSIHEDGLFHALSHFKLI